MSSELLHFLTEIYRENLMSLNTLRTPSNSNTSIESTQQVSECLMDINCYIVNSAIRLLREQMFPNQIDASLNNLSRIPTRPIQNRTQSNSISQPILRRENGTQSQNPNNRSYYNRNISGSNPHYLYDIISEYTIPLTQPTTGTTNTPNLTDPLITTLLRSFMDPIPLTNEGLNEEQILTSTRYCSYGNIVNPSNTSCPINLDVFQDNTPVCIIRGCGHIFKQGPIYSWLRSNPRCPVCRYDVRTYQPNNHSNANIPPPDHYSDVDEERSETDSIS